MIVTVPAATPVTTPALFTLATVVLDEVQGVVVAGVPEPFRLIVEPTQTALAPVIVGNAFTVMVVLTEQPLLFV